MENKESLVNVARLKSNASDAMKQVKTKLREIDEILTSLAASNVVVTRYNLMSHEPLSKTRFEVVIHIPLWKDSV